jgi:hypothetical protein
MTTSLEGGEELASPSGRYLPRERPGIHCTGGWVGTRAGLDRCVKFLPHQDSIPGPSSPYPVAIPTTLPGPLYSGSAQLVQYFDWVSCYFSWGFIAVLSGSWQTAEWYLRLFASWASSSFCCFEINSSNKIKIIKCCCWWLCGLTRRSAYSRLLGSRVRILLKVWMFQ